MLRSLIDGRVEMIPKKNEEGAYYEFQATGTPEPAVGIIPHEMASPTGFAASCTQDFEGNVLKVA